MIVFCCRLLRYLDTEKKLLRSPSSANKIKTYNLLLNIIKISLFPQSYIRVFITRLKARHFIRFIERNKKIFKPYIKKIHFYRENIMKVSFK